MPLIKSGGKEAVGKNIKELKASGRPQKQAIAIALDNQRRAKAKGFNKGGNVPSSKEQAVENDRAEKLASLAVPTGALKKGGKVNR